MWLALWFGVPTILLMILYFTVFKNHFGATDPFKRDENAQKLVDEQHSDIYRTSENLNGTCYTLLGKKVGFLTNRANFFEKAAHA